MTSTLSPNTQAILLLTAPLITGRGITSPDLLSPGEYKRLARFLREIRRQPADLVSSDAAETIRACQAVIDESRMQRLLGRGFLLSQEIERWQTRAIWVVSRADAEYPRRLKKLLSEDAPAILYGCGNIGLLGTGGLAVVGSRHVDDALIGYTMSIGRLTARAGRTLVSGGAKGIDQAAMRGALEVGGKVCGVLADSLEKTIMHRENRDRIVGDQLVLISPYDPCVGFNVGNAMQRNKLIYALAEAGLVINSDINKGGTWAGAVEQLNKFRFVPIYVRSTGEPSIGLESLRKKGAYAWPNPNNEESFKAVFPVQSPESPIVSRTGNSLVSENDFTGTSGLPPFPLETDIASCSERKSLTEVSARSDEQTASSLHGEETHSVTPGFESRAPIIGAKESNVEMTPANVLFAAVRQSIQQLLSTPMKDIEVAQSLEVSTAQAKVWLRRLVDEGIIEMQKKPIIYIVKQKRLFDCYCDSQTASSAPPIPEALPTAASPG